MKDLFGNDIWPDHNRKSRPNGSLLADGNPLIKLHGKGPEGKRCKHCAHLYSKHFSKVYYKCDLRPDTNGTGTDHRVNWPACGKFQKKEGK